MEKSESMNTTADGWLHGRLGTVVLWALLILRRSSLSLAFPLSSLVFVGVLLGSWLGLGEHISLLHWAGVAVIIVGIALLADGEPEH